MRKLKAAKIITNLLYLLIIVSISKGSLAVETPEIIVPQDQKISGLYQYDYVNMWWQWALSMDSEQSPIRDQVGTNCGINQIGPVWFLAGGYGTSRIKRKCSIPSEKYIFFPIINMLAYPNGDTNLTCESSKEGAAVNNQYLTSFKVKIDKQEFVNPVFYRISSTHCFDLVARKKNNVRHLEVYPSATDGYWIMLKPLSKGAHTISFRAEYDKEGSPFGKMIQDIEYTINIYEP